MFGSDFGGVSGTEVPASPAESVAKDLHTAAQHPAVAKAAAAHPAAAAAIASHPAVQAAAPHVAAHASQHAASAGLKPKDAMAAANHPATRALASSHPAVAAILDSHPGRKRPNAPSTYRPRPGEWGSRNYDPNAHHDTFKAYGDWVRNGRPAVWFGRQWHLWGWPWHWTGHPVHYHYLDRFGRPMQAPLFGWIRSRNWWPWRDVQIVYDNEGMDVQPPPVPVEEGSAPPDDDDDGGVRVVVESDDPVRAFLTDYAADPVAEQIGFNVLESLPSDYEREHGMHGESDFGAIRLSAPVARAAPARAAPRSAPIAITKPVSSGASRPAAASTTTLRASTTPLVSSTLRSATSGLVAPPSYKVSTSPVATRGGLATQTEPAPPKASGGGFVAGVGGLPGGRPASGLVGMTGLGAGAGAGAGIFAPAAPSGTVAPVAPAAPSAPSAPTGQNGWPGWGQGWQQPQQQPQQSQDSGGGGSSGSGGGGDSSGGGGGGGDDGGGYDDDGGGDAQPQPQVIIQQVYDDDDGGSDDQQQQGDGNADYSDSGELQ